MPEPRWGMERGRKDVYGDTPTRDSGLGKERVEPSVGSSHSTKRPTPQKQPVHNELIKQRSTPPTAKPNSRRMRLRPPIPAKYVEPVEVLTPAEDSEELRGQVHGLLEHIIGGVALSEEVEQVFQDDPERRSLLIQRAGAALENSGFAVDALMAPAERLSTLVLRYENGEGQQP